MCSSIFKCEVFSTLVYFTLSIVLLCLVAVLVAICFCVMLNYKATKGRVINTLGIIGERVKRARHYQG